MFHVGKKTPDSLNELVRWHFSFHAQPAVVVTERECLSVVIMLDCVSFLTPWAGKWSLTDERTRAAGLFREEVIKKNPLPAQLCAASLNKLLKASKGIPLYLFFTLLSSVLYWMAVSALFGHYSGCNNQRWPYAELYCILKHLWPLGRGS